MTDDDNGGGVSGRLQPNQHGSDETGALHGCHQTHVPYQSYHPPASGQCPPAGYGGQWQTEPHPSSCSHVRIPRSQFTLNLFIIFIISYLDYFIYLSHIYTIFFNTLYSCVVIYVGILREHDCLY